MLPFFFAPPGPFCVLVNCDLVHWFTSSAHSFIILFVLALLCHVSQHDFRLFFWGHSSFWVFPRFLAFCSFTSYALPTPPPGFLSFAFRWGTLGPLAAVSRSVPPGTSPFLRFCVSFFVFCTSLWLDSLAAFWYRCPFSLYWVFCFCSSPPCFLLLLRAPPFPNPLPPGNISLSAIVFFKQWAPFFASSPDSFRSPFFWVAWRFSSHLIFFSPPRRKLFAFRSLLVLIFLSLDLRPPGSVTLRRPFCFSPLFCLPRSFWPTNF